MNRRVNEKVSWGLVASFVVFFLFWGVGVAYSQGLLVIANQNTPELSRNDIRNLYLGFKRTLPDGTAAKVYLPKEVTLKEKFVRSVVGTDTVNFRTHWLSKALAGEAAVLKELGEEETIELVRRERGAIGVVSDKAQLPPEVKVILRVEKGE